MGKIGNETSRVSAETPRGVASLLLGWYDAERRDLPWRRTRDPYAIWVSEVMLQQTRVSTVIDYYTRWMERFPTLGALAAACDDDVLHAWQGLGYYRRARSLLASARAVVQRHGGALPADSAALRELPGIGRYSAGAIASIAFGRREPIVDGNVARVLCRFFALRGDATRGPLQRRLWELAAALVPADRPGDFNQALMELGATLCSVRAPRCDSCPLADPCRSRSLGMAEQLPEPVRRAAATAVHMVAAVVRRRGRVLVARTADDAPRWAGMWQFPTATLAPGEAPDAGTRRALRESVGSKDVDVHGLVVVVRHAVTRFAITLDAYACTLHGRLHPPHRGAAAWKQPHELGELALPAAHRKIARQLGA